MFKDMTLSRRRLLQGGAAIAGLATAPAFAKGPMLGTQAPYFYRFKLGNAEATIVSDGVLPLGDPTQAFLGLSKEEIARQLSSNFLPLENAVLEQNALIVNTGNHLVLFDTGMGTAKDFGPTTGKLLNSIKQAGIDPKDIDAVVMSHAHIDHLGGNVGDDGKSNFPNAQFYIQQSDLEYWTDEKLAGGPLKSFLAQAKKNFFPCATASSSSRTARNSCPASRQSARPAIRSDIRCSTSHRAASRWFISATSRTTRCS